MGRGSGQEVASRAAYVQPSPDIRLVPEGLTFVRNRMHYGDRPRKTDKTEASGGTEAGTKPWPRPAVSLA